MLYLRLAYYSYCAQAFSQYFISWLGWELYNYDIA